MAACGVEAADPGSCDPSSKGAACEATAAAAIEAAAGPTWILHQESVAGSVHGLTLAWDQCSNFVNDTEYIFLESLDDFCGDGTPGVTLYGFVSLHPVPNSSQQALEVCDYVGPSFTMIIDPANPDGSSSGDLLPYVDPIGGGCNKPAPKGYPMRKFMASWGGGLQNSDWDTPF
jgi:hypothetical protein